MVYGGVNVLLSALVLPGVIHPAGSVDRTALRWHVGVWDLWFLVWGISPALATAGYWRWMATGPPRGGQLTESTVNEGAANGQASSSAAMGTPPGAQDRTGYSARRTAHPARLRTARNRRYSTMESLRIALGLRYAGWPVGSATGTRVVTPTTRVVTPTQLPLRGPP